jgi:hypothetical protein
MKSSISYLAYMNSPYRSIKHSSYFHVYDELLAEFYGSDVTFIEIGVLNGGSLYMWRELFGKNSRIIGLDLNPSAKKWEKDGFEIYIGDQDDPNFWKTTLSKIGSFDVLLDDGGHLYTQQITTVTSVLDSANERAIIIVEDTHTSYMDGFGNKKWSFMEYCFEIVNRINQRSSAITNPSLVENRIHSINFFESIVAFRIDRAKSKNKSYPTDNLGEDSHAIDYRFASKSKSKIARIQSLFFRVERKLPKGKSYWRKATSLLLSPFEILTDNYIQLIGKNERRVKNLFKQNLNEKRK